MRPSLALCAALLVAPLATPRVASAQVEAGRVIDDSTRAPLTGMLVTLQKSIDSSWKNLDTTRTDRDGMFQLTLPGAGIYRVGFVGPAPLFSGSVDTVAADSMNQREYSLPIVRSRDSSRYFEFQVDAKATPSRNSPAPEYPGLLRSQGINGTVSTQFVVTPDGTVDMTTFSVLAATDPAFVESVRQFLPRVKFKPGKVGGVPIRQMVQQRFFFTVRRPY